MNKCRTCKNSIFDPVWGEYKCKRLGHTIYNPEVHADCEFYDENPNSEPTITKRWEV